MSDLTDAQYDVLFTFRCALRDFLRWSEEEAHAAGLTPQQHQLLLAVRAHQGSAPSIGDTATYLQIRHHSAVTLVRRVEALDLLRRGPDGNDGRIVRLYLTARGHDLISRLSTAHMTSLDRAVEILQVSEEDLYRVSADFLNRESPEGA